MFTRVGVVVKVNLELAESRMAKLGERRNDLGIVDFGGKEKGVAWRVPVGVSQSVRHLWVTVDPAPHAGPLRAAIHAAVVRLVVVGQTEEDVDRARGRHAIAVACAAGDEVPRKPTLGV